MSTETHREPQMGLTFEKVWAMFQETDRRIQEMSRETDRQIREMSWETDHRIREMSRETDRKISKLGNRVGELVEHLVAPNLLEKFKSYGFQFRKTSIDVEIKDADNSFLTEVDVLLENGSVALAVEVKSKLTVDDVKEHIDRMGKLRVYADEHQDSRKFLGAVAGAVIPEGVKPFAIKSGFFVIEQAGDTAKIDVPDGFIPREW
ncbi:MAG: restriction endonuclease, SacI family [Spirochaetaceae bacterium]|jgi:hypothetical protein|nr:restriction endonuclease, SacI family [Spirochaetaceae bacterium]